MRGPQIFYSFKPMNKNKFNGRYILNEQGRPIPEPDLLKWAQWFEDSGELRRVAHDVKGKLSISTVFIALDHSFGEGEPMLYETMVFGGREDMQERYRTREEALAGHKRILAAC
jgi:hypothetical protein